MEVKLHHIGKRFGKEWIVRGFNDCFTTGEHTAVLGPNGSGKSTLLKLIASYILPTEGNVEYHHKGAGIRPEDIFRSISYAAPYLELIGHMTLEELLRHHISFKPFLARTPVSEALEIMELSGHRDKQLRSFSSGMKMRVRLALAFLSDTPLVLLDEPTSNLDVRGKAWYRELAAKYLSNRLAIVCSNHQEEEYFFCRRQLILQPV